MSEHVRIFLLSNVRKDVFLLRENALYFWNPHSNGSAEFQHFDHSPFLSGTSCLKEADPFLLFYNPSLTWQDYIGDVLYPKSHMASSYRGCSAWPGNFCDYGNLCNCAGHMVDLLCSNMKPYHPTWPLSGSKVIFSLLDWGDGLATRALAVRAGGSESGSTPPQKSQAWLCPLVTPAQRVRRVGGNRGRQADSGAHWLTSQAEWLALGLIRDLSQHKLYIHIHTYNI